MNYNNKFTTYICCFIFSIAFFQIEESKAQVIVGVVSDQLTTTELAFVNIWTNNSLLGTITNENGHFQLDLRYSINISKLNITHLGYMPLEIDLSSMCIRDTVKIALLPISLALNEVVIRGDVRLRSAKQILKKLRFTFFNNYSPISYEAKGFYREIIKGNDKYLGFGEALCDFHFEGANKNFLKPKVKFFRTSWFKLREVKRSDYFIDFDYNGNPRTGFEITSIISYEKTVIYNMILNSKISRKMEFKILGDTIDSNSDQIYILEGRLATDSISKNIFENQYFDMPDRVLLYISSEDWSLHQVEIFRKSDTKSVIVPGTSMEKRNGETKVLIKYEKHNGVSKLNFISFRRSFHPMGWARELVGCENLVEEASLYLNYEKENLTILELEHKYKARIITDMGIRYPYDRKFEEIHYDEDFWSEYIPLVCSDFNQIKFDLEQKANITLSQQFKRNTNRNFISIENLVKLKKCYDKCTYK